jgi:hypothetical protein
MLKNKNPLDEPLPEYEVQVPVVDGYLNLRAAFDKFFAERGRTGSVVFRLPAGEVHLPPRARATDRKWSMWMANVGAEDGCIALLGAKNGRTVLKGDAQSVGGILNLTSSCIGTWRVGEFDFQDLPGQAFTFGTGRYNGLVNRMVLHDIRGRYCGAHFIMAAYEVADKIINDELWMRNVHFRWANGEHCVYIDQRAYTYVERCSFLGGKEHAFKCEALNTEMVDCVVSNIDPETLKPHVIPPGASALWPNGEVFYGANSPMSLLGIGKGHAKRVDVIKASREPMYVNGSLRSFSSGAYGAARQARWGLININRDLIDTPSPEYWQAARAAGIDNPENPYLKPHTWLWENCCFSMNTARQASLFSAIANQGTHPTNYNTTTKPTNGLPAGTYYYPVTPRQPDLWFERSRDYIVDCAFLGWGAHTKTVLPYNKPDPMFEKDVARAKRDQRFIFREFDRKPTWWPK